jgi:hypothetical protein
VSPRASVAIVGCVAALAAVVAVAAPQSGSRSRPDVKPIHLVRPHKLVPLRPPQFVVASFDGSGGAPLWTYWRGVAKRLHAHFTFFVSGVYLLDWAHHDVYRPPRHARGESAIGFAPNAAWVRGTLRGMALGYREGNEIGTHFNGHFCAPFTGSVGSWNAADWNSELDQFTGLLFGAARNDRLTRVQRLPFGPSEIVGARTPCLEGNLATLDPVLVRRGFRYDSSGQVVRGAWPHRSGGLWEIPLVEIPFIGHTFRVVAMDYNFMANQIGESTSRIENETYRSLWNAFRASYYGDRAPLPLGNHFETWMGGAYDRALVRFLTRACGMPEVRCASFRELVDWLDGLPPARLRRYRTGRFPRLHAPKLNRS